MIRQLWLLAFWVIGLSGPGFATYHPCLDIISPKPETLPFPVRYFKSHRKIIDFNEAVPDYDPSQEIMVGFDLGGHVDLFVGDLFVHTNFQGIEPCHRRSINAGVHVRVSVGKQIVDGLLGFIEEKKQYQCWGFSCHHNALLVLHHNGVHLNSYIPMRGSSSYTRILNNGFVDGNGNPFRQQILVTQTNDGGEHLEGIYNTLMLHQTGRGVTTLLALSDTKEEFKTVLLSRAPHLAPIAVVLETGDFSPLPPDLLVLAHNYFRLFEAELLTLVEPNGGSMNWLVAYSRGTHDLPLFKAGIRMAMLNSLDRLFASH